MAPECLEKVAAETSPAIDVWAIGIMFFAMLYGELPFNKGDEKELIKSIKSDPVKFPNTVPVTEGAKDVMRRMLEKDPAKRIELVDFVDIPYCLLEEEELEIELKESAEKWEKNRPKVVEKEEEKFDYQFMHKMDINKEEK